MALIATVALGIGQLDGVSLLLMLFAALAHLLGVQLPTVLINIPLNNKIQTLDVDAVSETAQKLARKDFEPR